MQTVTLSTKNQIAIPKFALQILGIQSGDKLLVQLEDKEIKIKPVGKSMIDAIAQSIKVAKDKKGVPFAKALLFTKKTVAKKLAAT